MRSHTGFAMAILVCTSTACGEPEHTDSAPQQRTLTIAVDGAEQQITLEQFRTPDHFPLQFTTYVPTDMVPKVLPAESGEGAAVQFARSAQPTESDDAFVHVFVYPAETSDESAHTLAQSFLISRGIPGGTGVEEPLPESPPTLPPYDWPAIQEDFAYAGMDGRWREGVLLLGREGDRAFHIILHYLADEQRTFVPVARLILEHWRWPNGSMLVTPRADASTTR